MRRHRYDLIAVVALTIIGAAPLALVAALGALIG
jgi:hypothetical protein